LWVNTLIGAVLTAYVDESYRRRRGESACVYTLVGVVVDEADLGDIRDRLRALRDGKAPRLHWQRERPTRLGYIAETIGTMPFRAVVVTLMHAPDTSSERARRYCLSSLLRRVHELEADRVVFESRRSEDHKDMAVIAAWRRARRPEALVRVDFVWSLAEPALWMADAVAGAFMWWLGDQCDEWHHLERKAEVLEIDEP
jgi:L-alanine-DL-glutamate epimerase-like enolase superfamily enzyme